METATQRERPPLPGGPYLVVGLARSGIAAAKLLAARGEDVLGCDLAEPLGAAELSQAGVELHLGDSGVGLIDQVETVIKSPGVPSSAPAIARALAEGLTVIGELELAWRLIGNRFCAITGTNGKTTVTEWIGHVHRSAGAPVELAGNVGTPLASLAGTVDPAATVVCETSSFQLEDAELFAPECAVLLNFSPDHLDRHGTLAAYGGAKLRIFGNQGPDDFAVYDPGVSLIEGRRPPGLAKQVRFCAAGGDECELVLRDGSIHALGEHLIDAADLALPGEHNVLNAMAVAAAAMSLGIPRDAVIRGLSDFGGVAHRLELVAELDGVSYVNDSKATNVAAAIAGIRSFDSGVHAILGGSLKGERFSELAPVVAERCQAAYLIGDAADALEDDLAEATNSDVQIIRCDGLDDAVRRASEASESGQVVLLTPACASFDAFKNFEERGERFRHLVGGLS